VFFSKRQDRSAPFFFQGVGENTCLLQSALKSIAPGLYTQLLQLYSGSTVLHCD